MRFFNIGERVRIDLAKIATSKDELPEDLQNFIDLYGEKTLLVRRIVKRHDDNAGESEYILAYDGKLHESSFYGTELIFVGPEKDWDN